MISNGRKENENSSLSRSQSRSHSRSLHANSNSINFDKRQSFSVITEEIRTNKLPIPIKRLSDPIVALETIQKSNSSCSAPSLNLSDSIQMNSLKNKEELIRRNHRSFYNNVNKKVSSIQVKTKKTFNNIKHSNNGILPFTSTLPLFTRMASMASNISTIESPNEVKSNLDNTSPMGRVFRQPSNPNTNTTNNRNSEKYKPETTFSSTDW